MELILEEKERKREEEYMRQQGDMRRVTDSRILQVGEGLEDRSRAQYIKSDILIDAYGRKYTVDKHGKKHYIIETESGKIIMKAPRNYSYYTFTEYNELFLTINGKPHLVKDDLLGGFRTCLDGYAWDPVNNSSTLDSSLSS